MSLGKSSLSITVTRFALAIFLIVAGIMTLQLDKGFMGKLQAGFGGNEIASAVQHIFKGDLKNLASPVLILMGILEVAAGAFLLVSFFVDVGNINRLILIIILIMWIVVIVLVDILGKGGLLDGAFKNTASFLSFLKILSAHLLVLGAILQALEA